MSDINKIIHGITAKATECVNSQVADMSVQAQELTDNEKLSLSIKVLVTKDGGVYVMDGTSVVKKEITTKVEIDTTTIDPDQPDMFEDNPRAMTNTELVAACDKQLKK